MTLLESLDSIVPPSRPTDKPLRLPLQVTDGCWLPHLVDLVGTALNKWFLIEKVMIKSKSLTVRPIVTHSELS